MTTANRQCKYCAATGAGNFCHNCGQPFQIKRITLKSMLHEVFHFFSHFDKGFPFTLKKLITSPGKMQRDYIEGERNNYQKPFSMFFICASIAALAMYWINLALVKYFNEGSSDETFFFHQYWVILQISMLPFYSFISWLVFKNSKLNYAEITVFQLYSFSFLFLIVAAIHLLKFIWPHLQTRYIEFPVILIYTMLTNIFFFRGKGWLLLLKTICVIALCYFLASFIQDILVKIFS